MKWRLICAVSLLMPQLAFAAETSSDLMVSGLKMLAGLVLVLGLLFLLYALSRKGLGFLPGSKEGLIRIIEVRSLGAKKGVCLIEVRGQELLLGFGPERIDCLARLGPAVATESFANHLAAVQGEKSP